MKEIPIQSKFGKIYSWGCYFLCILHQTKHADSEILELYDYFVSKGYMTEDCYIQDPVKILKYLTGNNYKVERTEKLPLHYDFAVYHYYNRTTGLGHFVLPDWDPLGDSVTRRNGVIDSYRVFTKI